MAAAFAAPTVLVGQYKVVSAAGMIYVTIVPPGAIPIQGILPKDTVITVDMADQPIGPGQWSTVRISDPLFPAQVKVQSLNLENYPTARAQIVQRRAKSRRNRCTRRNSRNNRHRKHRKQNTRRRR